MSEDTDAGVLEDVRNSESDEDHGSHEEFEPLVNGDNLNLQGDKNGQDDQDEILNKHTELETTNHEESDHLSSGDQENEQNEAGGRRSPAVEEEIKESSNEEVETKTSVIKEDNDVKTQPSVDQEMDNEVI